MVKRFIPFFLMATPAYALDTKPWLGDPYAYNLRSTFSYSRFSKVEGASRQLSSPVNDYDLRIDLGWTMAAPFDFQAEVEIGHTEHERGVFRSGALQARYQMLDDISGDPVSLTFGVNVRGVTGGFLRSITTPYAAEFDAELTCAVGKEWARGPWWAMRTYGFVSIGQANRGYPWTRELLVWQYNLKNTHHFTAFAGGEFGFGPRQHVDVKQFRGWSHIQHQSIDLGISYGYKLSFYGILSMSYAHRVFAHNYPEHVNFFMLEYWLPFSWF